MMEKLEPYMTTRNVVSSGVAVLSVLIGLKMMGILDLVVSYWAGFFSCLGLEVFLVYYFLCNFETKTNDKLDKYVLYLFSWIEFRGQHLLEKVAPPLRRNSLSFSGSMGPKGSGYHLGSAASSPGTSTPTKTTSTPVALNTKPTLEGVLTIQFVGKKKNRSQYNCALRGGVLYYKKRAVMGSTKLSSSPSLSQSGSSSPGTPIKDHGSGELKQMVLTGAQIRRVEDAEYKGMKYAIEVIHPDRKIIYKIDYIFLMTDTELDLERWYFALLTCCVPHNGYIDVELNRLLHDRFRYIWRSQETANWLSALWARFHLNMRVSQSVREKIISKVALRLGEKIEEKNLQNYIGNLQISDLDLGSKPPTIESAMIQPPDSSGDLVTDIWLHYRNGDATLTLSCEVNLKRITTIPISMTVSCRSLSGKLQLRVPPFPAERFSISFYEEPTMDLIVEMAVGEKSSQVKNLILPTIKDIIVGRLKLAIVERFVAPHRKYFKIPATTKKDPVSDRPTSFNVKTSLKAVPQASSSAGPSPLSASALAALAEDSESPSGSPALPRNLSTPDLKGSGSRSKNGDALNLKVITVGQASSSNGNGEFAAVFEEKLSAKKPGDRESVSQATLAAHLEDIGLAPVPEADRLIPGKGAPEEQRLSTKMKGFFKSLVGPSNSQTPTSPHSKQ